MRTSTVLGHPVGCAMALAQIRELESCDLIRRSAELGEWLLQLLLSEISNPASQFSVRGVGLLVGLELSRANGSPATGIALKTIKAMLHRGFILLPEGENSN